MVSELFPSGSMEGIVDRMIYTCPSGELIDTETGLITGYNDFENYPSLTTNGKTLLRHWDGMNASKLSGSTAKIITLSRDDIRLLKQIRPFKFLKMEMMSDYLRLIDKINAKRLSISISVRMRNMWADPTSVFNSPEHRIKLGNAIRAGQSTPEAKRNMSFGQIRRFARPEERLKISISATKKFKKHPELRVHLSETTTLLWKDEAYREKTILGMSITRRTPEFREKMRNAQSHESRVKGAKKAWVTRRLRHGKNGFSDRPRKGTIPPRLRELDEFELKSYQNMVWAYHTTDYAELTASQRRRLRGLGLIEQTRRRDPHKGRFLTPFGKDVLSTIDVGNAPLVRL